MSTETISTEILDDLKAVCASISSKRPLDPVVARRVHERAEKVREELRKRGPMDIAVDLIREAREEL